MGKCRQVWLLRETEGGKPGSNQVYTPLLGQLVQTGSTVWQWNNLEKMAPVWLSFADRKWEWSL